MKAGDIVFVRGTSLVSKFIRWVDPGKFTHVAIAVSNQTVLEAAYNIKVRETEFYFDDDKEVEEYEIVDIGLSDYERALLAEYGRREIGKWYDFTTIFWILIKRFFRLKGKNRLNSPNNYICTELVNYLLTKINKIPDGTNLTDSTPNQLYEYLVYQFPQTNKENA